MAEEVVGILRTILQIDRSDLANGLKLAGADADAFKKKMGDAMADVEKALGRPEAAVKRLEASLRGDKLLANANRLVQGITNVGGATKLTEQEQARANATLQKAIEKYKALGQEAPADLLKVERATRAAGESAKSLGNIQTFAGRAQSSISSLTGSFGMMAAGFTTAGIVAGLVSLGKEAIAEAGHLADMSAKTGLSAEMLQRLEFVAGQAGGTLDDFTNASFRLGVRLSSGSQSVNKAVEQLGLNFATLRHESPEQQFTKIVDALARVQNEQERNRIGVELFGKAYGNIASAVAQNMSEIAKGASVMSNAQVKAFDEAGDAIDRWLHKLKVASVTALGGPLVSFEKTQRIGALQAQLGALVSSEDMRGDLDAILARLEGKLKQLDDRDKARSGTAGDHAAQDKAPAPTAVQQLKALDAQIAKLTATQRAEIDASLAMGKAHNDLEDQYGLMDGAIDRYISKNKEATKAVDQHAEAVKRAMDQFAGGKEQEQAANLVEGLGMAGVTDPNAALPSNVLAQLTKLPKEKLQEMADVLQAGLHDEIRPAVTGLLNALERLGAVPKIFKSIADGLKEINGLTPDAAGNLPMMSASASAALDLANAQAARRAEAASPFSTIDTTGITGQVVDEFGNVSDSIETIIDKEHEAAVAVRDWEKAGLRMGLTWQGALLDLGQALSHFSQTSDSAFGRAMADLAQYIDAVNVGLSGAAATQAGFSQFQAGGTSNRISGGVQMATGAIQVASGFMGATESGSDAARIGKGALYGAQIGSNYAGGAGAIVGLGVGAIGGAIRATGPSKEEKEARAAYADWSKQVIANFDAVATSQQKLEAGGEDWRKVNVAIRDSYLATGRTADQAMRDLARLNNATRESAEDVAKALKHINEALTEQQQDQDRATTAAEKYGLTVRNLARGSAGAQNIETKSAKELIENWRVLTDAGYDVTAVNAGMAADVNAFLADVKATGSVIPSIMKPILDSMAHQGVLFDENGQRIDELGVNALTFKDIFTDGLAEIAVKLDKVITRLIQVGSLMTGIDLSTIEGANANIAANSLPQNTAINTSHGPLGNFYQSPDGTWHRYHRGGFLVAHGGRFLGGQNLFGLKPDEVPIIAQTGEAVMSRFATQMLGGKSGVDTLNAGRVPSNLGWMMPRLEIADPMASVYAAAARVSQPMVSAAAMPSAVNASAVMAAVGAGETHVYLQLAPGAVSVSESKNPRVTAREVVAGLKQGIAHDEGGIRTVLIKHVGKPAAQRARRKR